MVSREDVFYLGVQALHLSFNGLSKEDQNDLLDLLIPLLVGDHEETLAADKAVAEVFNPPEGKVIKVL